MGKGGSIDRTMTHANIGECPGTGVSLSEERKLSY